MSILAITSLAKKSCCFHTEERTLVAVNELNLEDINLLIESLRYTKRNLESTNYPTDALRRQQLERVDQVMEKLRRIRDSLK